MPLSPQSNEFLSRFLAQRFNRLHRSIMVQGQNGPDATESLALFIERYVDLAADIVATLKNVTNSIGTNSEMAQQTAMAQQFLDIPLTIVSRQQGLEAQMYQAYLACRLVEELNDVIHTHFSSPVISTDITKSNLIVHHIIGEPFANQLDAAIQSLSDRLVRAIETDSVLQSELRVYCSSVNKQGMPNYPCLAEACHIYLVFNTEKSASD
ncbi:hypothetical protein OAT22_08655 [Porticoccaceae bacterium]|nr:hypothetical protein [Porticoccaceae bacterium]